MDSWEKITSQGQELLDQGDYGQAFKAFFKAIHLDPRRLEGWVYWARSLRFLTVTQQDFLLKKTMVDCLAKPIANHQDIAFAGISMLKLLPDMQKLIELSALDNVRALEKLLLSGTAFNALNDPLLLSLMEHTILADAELEKLLTLARSLLLKNIERIDEARALPFTMALARQCDLNEFIYAFTLEELDLLKNPRTPLHQALVNCYGSPSSEAFESAIATWGAIQDEVSLKVQTQYEENPYPHWTCLNPVAPTTIPAFIKKQYPHAQIKEGAFPAQPRILIAGCGTGQHALNTANQFKDCKEVALDLSRASLVYASKKALELGIGNIEFLQADILALENYPQRFDLIECTGVLHHMARPVDGWRILKKLLLSHGVMHIGLYSEIGRQDILAARQLIGDNADIRECRQLLFSLPEGELAKEVTRTIDFYTMSSCRDLLFHVQEHRFTLPQISGILNDLALEFIGFDFRDPMIKKQYAAAYPSDKRMTSLEQWHQFEQDNPRTFSGMYQFWVRNR